MVTSDLPIRLLGHLHDLLFDQFFKAEAFGDGKGHCHNRDNVEQRIVGQNRSGLLTMICDESSECQKKNAQGSNEKCFDLRADLSIGFPRSLSQRNGRCVRS